MNSKLTVMIFKDELPSKTFQLPVRWVPWMSASITAAVVAILALGLLTIQQRYKIRQLRQQTLTAPSLGAPAPNPPTLTAPELAELTQLRQEVEKLKQTGSTPILPTPTVSAINPAKLDESPNLPETTSLYGASIVTFPEIAPGTAKIGLDPVQMIFKNGKWNIRFNIHYEAQDGNYQQGRFALVARGPGMIQVWPKKILQFKQQDKPLIDLGKAETFSVARFREVRADFTPIDGKDALKELLILVIDPEGKPIIQKTVPFQ